MILMFGLIALSLPSAQSQLYDSLDTYPPRWHLASSDCDARVLTHKHLPDGGFDGRSCEVVTTIASHGSEIVLAYPIEPCVPIDGLTANLSVMSARAGASVGFRIRFPNLLDRVTHQPVAVFVYGANYNNAGKFAAIGVGMIERPLQVKIIALRNEYGSDANVEDPYVDAVVVNAYTGAGVGSARLDELRVDGLVSVSDVSKARKPISEFDPVKANRMSESATAPAEILKSATVFPNNKITKVLQYNGEPLAWVRSLGFDAVLLSKPPTAAILNEAIRTRMMIYAPPPSSPEPALETLLSPIAAWYIGHNEALDATGHENAEMSSRRMRGLPPPWARPIVGAPSESFSNYIPLMDAMFFDMPQRARGVTADEEASELTRFSRRVGNRNQVAVGISSEPGDRAMSQSEAIADAIGAPRPAGFRWHSMWLQTMRAIEVAPSAVLYRSTRSLASGTELDNERSMSLSFVNRVTSMIEPWIVGAIANSTLPTTGAPYRCGRLTKGDVEILVLSTTATRGSEVLAGDGQSVSIELSPTDAKKTVWRMTHFSAERLTLEATTHGASVTIVSPDVAEVLVMSSDPSMGGILNQSAMRFAKQAALDRWQLASDSVRQTRDLWKTASSSRIGRRAPPFDLIDVAGRTLADAEPLYRAGETDASMRMARRADAWALRSQWQLSETLMPDWPRVTSCPPIDCGAPEVQIAWYPLMQDKGWGRNLLSTGSLDSATVLDANRWRFGKRLEGRAKSEVVFSTRGSYAGAGSLIARSTSLVDDSLAGGYEGTIIQVRSPSIKIPAGTAVRIDALVRTLGFGGPHQGLLVYDSVGGQEMGVLVRGRSAWTPVRLYRHTLAETDLSVMFEVIGEGEAMMDEVEVRVWEPADAIPPELPFRPISNTPMVSEAESTKR